MKYIVLITFITIALIQIGIFINSVTLVKIYPNEKSLKYWAYSLILNSTGIISITTGSALMTSLDQGSLFLTLSNTIYFTSLVMLVLYSKSLKEKRSSKMVRHLRAIKYIIVSDCKLKLRSIKSNLLRPNPTIPKSRKSQFRIWINGLMDFRILY